MLGKSRNQKKALGQFFTPAAIAQHMASLINFQRYTNDEVYCLDAGAGNGRLSVALLEAILRADIPPRKVVIDLYEIDASVLLELAQSLEAISAAASEKGTSLVYHIFEQDYLLSPDTSRYDIAIMNPPYKKVGKQDAIGKGFDNIIAGQPNLYFLFMEKMIRQLRPGGEFSVICPRSWTAGLYFRKFRISFLNRAALQDVFLFSSRNGVFGMENVLQETMIVHGRKCEPNDSTKSFMNLRVGDLSSPDACWSTNLPFDECIYDQSNKFFLLPSNDAELSAIRKFSAAKSCMMDHDFVLKTGPVVEFRSDIYLSKVPQSGYVPMIRAEHLQPVYGKVLFPVTTCSKAQYISRSAPKSQFVKNQNMLLFRRFSAKEANRRLQAVPYYKAMFPDYDYISLENHVSYLIRLDDRELTDQELQSLEWMFLSEDYELFYRSLDGSTQLNSTEFNLLPFLEAVS